MDRESLPDSRSTVPEMRSGFRRLNTSTLILCFLQKTNRRMLSVRKWIDQGDVKTYYIGIRYEEKPTNPVSVYLPSGSCEEKTCENSRYKEGFCIEVVDCCPEKYPPGLLKTLCDCENGVLPDASTQLCRDCGQPPKDFTGYNAQGQGQGRVKVNSVDSVAWCKCVRLEEFCETSVECPDCCSCDKCCYRGAWSDPGKRLQAPVYLHQ